MTWRILPDYCNSDANSKKPYKKNGMCAFFAQLWVNFAQHPDNAPKVCAIEVRADFSIAPAKGETSQSLISSEILHYFFPTESLNACYSVALQH